MAIDFETLGNTGKGHLSETNLSDGDRISKNLHGLKLEHFNCVC